MAIKESPLAKVKRLHGSKEALVDSLVSDVAKDSDESEGDAKQRLMSSSNTKLLRLQESFKTMRDKYGSKDGLAEALAKAQGKAKDSDYVAKLRTLPINRLLDMMRAASKRPAA